MEEYICKYLQSVRPNHISVEYIKNGRKCIGDVIDYNGDSVVVSPRTRNYERCDIVRIPNLLTCSKVSTPTELIRKFYSGILVNDGLPEGLIIKDCCLYGRIESRKDTHGYEYTVRVGKWNFETAGFILTGAKSLLHLPFKAAYDTAFEKQLMHGRTQLLNNAVPVLSEEEKRRGRARYRKNDLIMYFNRNLVAEDYFKTNGISDCRDENYASSHGLISGKTDQGYVVRELLGIERTGKWYPDSVGKTIYEELCQNFAPVTKIVSYRNLPAPGTGRFGFLDNRGLWWIKHYPREWNGYTDRY